MNSQRGFTLIELLTVIVILGILSSLGMYSFSVYKQRAAYIVTEQTLGDARTDLEASITNLDNPPGSVALFAQSAQGALQNAAAAALLPSTMVPRNIKFQVSYDADCIDGGCQSEFIQINHCNGTEFVRWIRFGDGVDVLLDHLAGVGCP
jgi:prepilin-type N-terminal cleavage/methylation domain-containing protein